MSDLPPLLKPVKIRDLELQNRVVLAPLTRARSGEDRVPKDVMAEYYAQRASAGLLIAEATTISEQGNGWVNSPGIYTDEMMDGLAFGFHELGEPMTLQDFRKVFDGPLMGNCGYDFETAKQAIEDGGADLIAIGRPYISNPDLVERWAAGAALNPEADMKDWYNPGGAEGYTDFPCMEPQGVC